MLKIFVNTWGNYNRNGADGGEWLTLPLEPEELTAELARIAEKMNDHDPEWAIHDYEWDEGFDAGRIEEGDNIQALNEWAQRVEDLSRWDFKTYAAAVEVWGVDYVDLDELDEYNLYTDIETDYDLGYYWAQESGCYDLRNIGHLANYIDYEAFGRDIRLETDGGFTSYGWIEKC